MPAGDGSELNYQLSFNSIVMVRVNSREILIAGRFIKKISSGNYFSSSKTRVPPKTFRLVKVSNEWNIR